VMGVVGIVASRMVEHFYRPTVILTKSNGMATGSARSVDGYDVYNAINSCSDLLESFGGHKYAAGLTLPLENIEAFIERFEEYVSSTISNDQLIPQIEVDREICLSDITPRFFRVLKQFEPFGPENPAPVFVARKIYDTGKSRQVGRGWEHLKLSLTDGEPRTPEIEAIAFNMGHLFNKIHRGDSFDICFSIEENVFRGVSSIQLMIRDIQFQ
jgi:single-stranded-DNA-specific exonuclease